MLLQCKHHKLYPKTIGRSAKTLADYILYSGETFYLYTSSLSTYIWACVSRLWERDYSLPIFSAALVCSYIVGPTQSSIRPPRKDVMLLPLQLLSALVSVTLCLKWPSTTYAIPDRCRLPVPNDIHRCAYPQRVYYNTPQGQCVPYAYCGAAGSMYGFETWEECEMMCGMQGDVVASYQGKCSVIQPVHSNCGRTLLFLKL